jgi:hypothetical protein
MCSGSPEKEIMEIAKKAKEEISRQTGFSNNEGKDYFQKSLMSFGTDTHVPLAESVSSRYSSLAVTFCRDLIAEYNCKTVSEKATAQLVANAYVRVMEYSRKMEYGRNLTDIGEAINGHYSMIGKELDRANRHYISALAMLKQLKSPPFQIQVTTKNAFVAQNQQINSK